MQFSYVPPEALSRIPSVIKYLKSVEPYLLPRADAFSVYEMCLTGEAQLWGVFADDVSADTVNESLEGVVVTKVTSYPLCNMLTITALAGNNADEWLGLAHSTLTAYRRKCGLLGLEEWGRDGWIRKLPKFGFRKSYVLMEDIDGQEFTSAQQHDIDGHSDQPS